MSTVADQIAAQNVAQAEAKRTGKPVEDRYGSVWHPPDGVPIVSSARTVNDDVKAKLDRLHASAVDHLFVTYLGLYKREQPVSPAETVAVAGSVVAALLEVAARVALDLGMTPTQLQAILAESYARAEAGAPKWG